MNPLCSKIALILAAGATAQALEAIPAAATPLTPLTNLTTWGTAQLARLLGMPVFVDGDRIFTLGYGLQIVPSCNNLVGMTLVAAGLATLPGRAIERLGMATVGLLLVFAANCLRIGTVLMIGTRNRDAAHIVHEVALPLLYLALALVLMSAWLRRQQSVSPRTPELAATSAALVPA
jgi:exosortase/archaeosortase family protein